MRTKTALSCLLALSSALSAAEPPGRVLNLARWKLTLPVDTDRPGKPDELLPRDLQDFVDPDCFFATAEGVAFRAACGGATTKGSKYPRCELRELQADGKSLAAWSTDDGGVHFLSARLAVTHTPPVKQHVVCAQIHDAEDDVLMVRLEGSKLLIERKDVGDVLLDPAYQLGTPFDLKLEAARGEIRVWYNAAEKLKWSTNRKGCYFKAGCYTQSNVKQGDAADAFGQVVLYRLQVEHR